jgi:putative methionine-R-sulfoxide reductase with GAF domain/HAMP domain-containing protein
MTLQFLTKSIKAKVAAFFLVFALLIVAEMIVLSILRKKALALPKQIELVSETQYYFQEARLSFHEYLSKSTSADEAINYLSTAQSMLEALLHGGMVVNNTFNFPELSGDAGPVAEKLLGLIKNHHTNMVDIAAKQKILGNIQLDSSNLQLDKKLAASYLRFQKQIIGFQNSGTQMKTEFSVLLNELKREMGSRQSVIALLMGVILILDVGVLGFFFLFMSRNISNPLKEIADAAMNQRYSTTQKSDEIGTVATNLNNIIKQLTDASVFIKAIGDGQLDAKLEGTSEGSSLSQSLINMQLKLRSISEEEQKRKWATEGLAKFVEIIRSGESNLSTLGDNIIKALVTYTGATQGGLYVWNDDQADHSYLELISSYAFNRKKYEKKSVQAGEGLLGQAYLEKITKYITEIPHDYFRIVSGLGETDPQSILIVPLLSDDKVYGLVELASLKKFEPYEIAFVEKLGETLASTLASVKTNEKNRKLLQDFQEQTESLRSQEEEMRQNMEELTATQEEMSRKENDYIKKISELEEKLRQASADGQWAIARDASEALQANLQALDLSLQTLRRPN